jgi:hypothetical protein
LVYLLTLLYPLLGIGLLRRASRSAYSTAPLIAALPVLGNAILSYLTLQRVIIHVSIASQTSVVARAASVGQAQGQLLLGAAVSVVTAVLGIAFVAGTRRSESTGLPLVRSGRSASVILALMILAVVSELVAAELVLELPLNHLVAVYYGLLVAAVVCAMLLAAGIVAITFGRSAALKLPSRHPLVPLLAFAAFGTAVAVSAWAIQSHCFHLAMYGTRGSRDDSRLAVGIVTSTATVQPAATGSPARGVVPQAVEAYDAYRVGGDVKPPVVIARQEARIPPNTPCRGLVQFHCVIDDHGKVTGIEDLSPQRDAFSRAYQEALEKTKFQPGTLHGKPVPVEYTMSVNFRCQ